MQPAGKSATHIEIAALDWGIPVGGMGGTCPTILER